MDQEAAPAAVEGESAPKELFISYGREPPLLQFVTRLRKDLESNGFTVWLDLQDIPSGSDWHGAIGGGLHQCRAILPIITNKYVSSTYCVKELYTADGDRKLIFPIWFEDVDLDKDQTTQGIKFTISSINWTMCRPGKDDYNNSISRLISDLKAKGLGDPDYKGPGKKIVLGEAARVNVDVGPKDTSEPVYVITDTDLIGGITTAPTGEIIFSSGGPNHCITVYRGEEKIRSFGKMGIMGPDEIISPAGMAVTSSGELVVASQYHLKRFTLEGEVLGTVGSYLEPEGDCTLQGPVGLAVGKEGRIYVVETAKNRVKIFNSDFTYHSSFSKADRRLGPGRLNSPMNVAINSCGEVFVTDIANNEIQVFSAEGEYLWRFKKQGTGLGSVTSPIAIAVDAQDYVYVASGTDSISIFKTENDQAEFMKAFGSHGAELGCFNAIRCMHIDREGKLYVGEMTSKRIQVFQ